VINKLIFLGPPGAGKGTQAQKLEKDYGYKKISTGDILREEVSKSTDLGKLASQYMERGLLVPDDVMIQIIKKWVNKFDKFVLDGFPRTLKQAEELEKIVPIDRVIYFEITKDEVIKRLSARRICPKCKVVYNLLTNPPKNDEICDLCGSKLERRHDDAPEVINKRFEVYEKQTLPLLEFYNSKDLLIKIDASGNIDEVYQRLKKVLFYQV